MGGSCSQRSLASLAAVQLPGHRPPAVLPDHYGCHGTGGMNRAINHTLLRLVARLLRPVQPSWPALLLCNFKAAAASA